MVENYDNYKGMTVKQIDEAMEDDFDLEDDEILQQYRQQRIVEMQAYADKTKWGSIIDINK